MTRIQTATTHHRLRRGGREATGTTTIGRSPVTILAVAAGALALVVWAFWPVVYQLIKEWQADPNYSVGQLVPFAALYLLWQNGKSLRKCTLAPCWWGLAIILAALLGRLFGVLYLYESAERYAFVLTIVGVVLLLAGRQVFWRTRWILVFLFLMVPLPGRIHNMIAGPLQNFATTCTVMLLELCGVVVTQEGNVMVLNHSEKLAVAEACSGLRMLTAFVVVAFVFAYIAGRGPWRKAIVVASSIPVAIICNIARLAVTAVLFLVASSAMAERFFHDFAGITMMPLAVILLLGEVWLLSRLVIEEPAATKQPKAG